MRRTTMFVGRIISLCLAFILGFFSAFGAIAGGIYYAYSGISVQKLAGWAEKLGIELPIDDFINPDAEKPLSTLSMQDLLGEILALQNSEITLQEMIEVYGLILPDDIVDKLPEKIMSDVPFTFLFSAEGTDYVMENVTVSDIFGMIPPEILATMVTDPMRETVKDHTLADIVEMDMGYIFNGVQLGYITGVTYELDEEGRYQVVIADPENPTLMELIAPLDLGGILAAVSNGEGNVMQVIENSIGDVAVNTLLGTFMADITLLNNLIGDATLGDLIVEDPETGDYMLDIMVALDGKKVGSLLGYTEVETIDPETEETVYVWTDETGEEVKGITGKFADIYVTDFMNGDISTDEIIEDLTIADILEYEKGENLPVFMHDNLENPLVLEEEIIIWYQNGVIVDKMMGAFADKTITWISTSVSTLKLSDILGYYNYEDEWYSWNIETVNGSDAIVLTPGDSIMSEIAGTAIGELSNVGDTLRDVQIATLLGYESICDENGEHLYWSTGVDENGNPIKASGITASIADLTVNELSDGTKLQETIDGISIAEVLGYTKGEDGNWYKGKELVTGPMAALADSNVGSLAEDVNKISIGKMLGHTPVYVKDSQGNDTDVVDHWLDKNGNEVSGIMSAFVGFSINDMSDNGKVQSAIQDIELKDVLGLELNDEGEWVNSDGSKASGIMAALATSKVGELSKKMNDITVADMLGLKNDNGVWKDSEGNKASGVISALAGSSINTLNKDLNELKIGKVAGYEYLVTEEYPEGAWYRVDGDNKVKATGILAQLADLTVNDLSNDGELTDRIGNVKVAEALGYTFDPSINGWRDKSGAELEGIMSVLADRPINDMGNALDDLTIDDVIPGAKSGIFTIIDTSKPINQLDTAINDSIQSAPIQFFIDKGLITFEEPLANTLDFKSRQFNDYTTPVGDYNYPNAREDGTVPAWRTKNLSESFTYIINLATRIN